MKIIIDLIDDNNATMEIDGKVMNITHRRGATSMPACGIENNKPTLGGAIGSFLFAKIGTLMDAIEKGSEENEGPLSAWGVMPDNVMLKVWEDLW